MVRKKILHLLAFVCLSWALSGAEARVEAQERLRADVEFLASDSLEGREAGKRGNEAAALFIKGRLTQLGYQRLPGSKSMLLPFGEGPSRCSNVAAWIPGSCDEAVIVGAHFDHIGFGQESSVTRQADDSLYNGANDNASGVAGILEVARSLKDEGGQVRSLVIVAFNAEEKGLLGSLDFSKKMKELLGGRKVVAMINLDMIGQMPDGKFMVMGSDSSVELTKILNQCAENKGVSWKNEGYIPLSDHHHFYKKRIPVLFFFSGIDANYHGPNDEFETLNYKTMTEFIEYLTDITGNILKSDSKIDYLEISDDVSIKSMNKIKLSTSIIDLGINCNDNYEVTMVYKSGLLTDFNIKLGDKLLSINDTIFSFENIKIIKSLKSENISKISVLSDNKRVRLLQRK